jgi:hypothetical protein
MTDCAAAGGWGDLHMTYECSAAVEAGQKQLLGIKSE